MNLPVYCVKPIDNKKKVFCHHYVFYEKKRLWIVPEVFSKKTINPKTFLKLKKKYNIESIIINDYLKPKKDTVCIIDHINQAGTNFLIGNTPELDLPTFPDMSNIYSEIKDLKKNIVYTVGPKRFLNSVAVEGKTISHSVGLISPVWHYVGVKVFAQNNL